MKIWRSNGARAGACASAAALVCVLAAGPLAAQSATTIDNTGQPIELVPIGSAAPESTTPTPTLPTPTLPGASAGSSGIEAVPLPGTAPATGALGTTSGVASPSGIEVQELGSADAYGGTLEPAQGGFGFDLWQGNDRAAVAGLLQGLPLALGSPAARDLTRRLLLSAAEAPAGAPPSPDAPSLMALRAEKLRQLGNLADMRDFAALLPPDRAEPAIARLKLDRAWLAGDLEAGCDAAASLVRLLPDALEVQKAQIFCHLLKGREKEAQLGIDLLHELGHEDALFYVLIDLLNGYSDVTIPETALPSALDLAIARQAAQPIPPIWATVEDPAILAALAVEQSLALDLRLGAAERAAAAGALDIDVLTQLYNAVPSTADDLSKILAQEDADLGPLGRALLYQAQDRAQQPALRVQLLDRSLDLARRFGGYPVAAAIDGPALLQLQPTPDLGWFAGDVGRVFYFTGRFERAGAWLQAARLRANNDAQAAESVRILGLYELVAGAAQPLAWAPDAVEQWRAAQEAAGDPDAARRAARLFGLLAALDQPVGESWRALAGGDVSADAALADPTIRQRLDQAAAAGRRGETVALALAAIGPAGPAAAEPTLLHQAIRALRAVGLESEARAIAFETLIGNGL